LEFKEATQKIWSKCGVLWDSYLTAFYTYPQTAAPDNPGESKEVKDQLRFIRQRSCGIRTYEMVGAYSRHNDYALHLRGRLGGNFLACVLSVSDPGKVADIANVARACPLRVRLQRLVTGGGIWRREPDSRGFLMLLLVKLGDEVPTCQQAELFVNHTRRLRDEFGDVSFAAKKGDEIFALPMHSIYPLDEYLRMAMVGELSRVGGPTADVGQDQSDAMSGLMSAIRADMQVEKASAFELFKELFGSVIVGDKLPTSPSITTNPLAAAHMRSLLMPRSFKKREQEEKPKDQKELTFAQLKAGIHAGTISLRTPEDEENAHPLGRERGALTLTWWTGDSGQRKAFVKQFVESQNPGNLLRDGKLTLVSADNKRRVFTPKFAPPFIAAWKQEMKESLAAIRAAKADQGIRDVACASVVVDEAMPSDANVEKEQATLTFEQLAQGLSNGSLSLAKGKGKVLMLGKSDKHIALTWKADNLMWATGNTCEPVALTLEFCRTANEGNLLRGDNDTVTLTTASAATYQFELLRHAPQGCRECEEAPSMSTRGACSSFQVERKEASPDSLTEIEAALETFALNLLNCKHAGDPVIGLQKAVEEFVENHLKRAEAERQSELKQKHNFAKDSKEHPNDGPAFSQQVGDGIHIDRAGTVTIASGADYDQVLRVIDLWQAARLHVAQRTSHLPSGRYAVVYTQCGLGLVAEISYKADDRTMASPLAIIELGSLGVTISQMEHPESDYEKTELRVPLPKAKSDAERVIRDFVESVESTFSAFINHVS
jgi:hypothetical protein